jgi:hypothetical protein
MTSGTLRLRKLGQTSLDLLVKEVLKLYLAIRAKTAVDEKGARGEHMNPISPHSQYDFS